MSLTEKHHIQSVPYFNIFTLLFSFSLISYRVVCFELSNDYSASGIGIPGRNPELVSI